VFVTIAAKRTYGSPKRTNKIANAKRVFLKLFSCEIKEEPNVGYFLIITISTKIR